jgi:hypothetical protein
LDTVNTEDGADRFFQSFVTGLPTALNDSSAPYFVNDSRTFDASPTATICKFARSRYFARDALHMICGDADNALRHKSAAAFRKGEATLDQLFLIGL